MFFAVALSTNVWSPIFWNQPIDIILYDFLVWFGWVPIVITMIWGSIMVWHTTRQEKWAKSLKYVLMAVDVPAITEQTPKSLENMFASLWGATSNLTWKENWILGKTQPLFSFEIVSTEGYVQFYIRTLTRYRDVAEAGIYAAYPEAEISEVEDYSSWAPTSYPHETWDCWGTELVLKNPDIFPLRTYLDFEDKISGELKDPLGGVLEQLAKMRPGEHFWIQFIVQPDGASSKLWKKEGEGFINKTFGVEKKHKPGLISSTIESLLTIPSAVTNEALGIALVAEKHEAAQEDMWKAFKITMAEKEQVEGVLKKIGKVGLRFKLRLVYLGRKGVYDKQARTAFVKGMFHQYAHQNLNWFTLHGDATPKDDYFWQAWTYPTRQGRLVNAFKKRSWGMGADPKILNTEELASLWHFPSLLVKAPLVKKAEAKRGEPPVGLPIGPEDEEKFRGRPAHLSAQAEANHTPAHGSDAGHDAHEEGPMIAEPEIHLPAPSHAANDEEVELGLDATDMGPPADVELPGPPPGWTPGPEDVPPNLPV